MNNRLRERLELEQMADNIEAVLGRHNICGRISGGTLSHRLAKFDLVGPSLHVERVQALADDIGDQLKRDTARVYRDNGRICIEIPLEPSRLLRITKIMEQVGSVEPMTAILGNDGEQPLLLRITGNVLIAGDSGSGKTALLRALVASLAYYNRDMQFALIDPQERGLGPLRQLPNARLFTKPYDAYDWAGRQKAKTLICIDELADVGAVPTELLKRGAKFGLHSIAATQQPGRVDRQLFNVQIAGQAAQSPWPDCERLAGGGDFQLFTVDQRLRFQAAWLGVKELEKIIAEVKR